MAAVGVFRKPPGKLVAYRASAPAGRQPAGGGVCKPIPFPSQPHRHILRDPEGPVLTVGGGDLLDGTPILDIKPYVPLSDCRPQARGGFSDDHRADRLSVDFPPALLAKVPEELREALWGVLEGDPRPGYHHDPERVYGLPFSGLEVKFTVADGVLQVRAVEQE